MTPISNMKIITKMLKAIHASENRNATKLKAKQVVGKLKEKKLKQAIYINTLHF